MRETFEAKVKRALAWRGKDFLRVLPPQFLERHAITTLANRRLSGLPLAQDGASSTGVADAVAQWIEWLGPVEVCHAQLGMTLLRSWIEDRRVPRSHVLYKPSFEDGDEDYWALDAWQIRERIETIVRVPVATCVRVARCADRELAIAIAQNQGTSPTPDRAPEWEAEFDRLYAMATADRSGRVRSAWLDTATVCVHPEYPKISDTLGRSLVRGTTTVAKAAKGLTRREAHEWLLDGATLRPAQWLVFRVTGRYDLGSGLSWPVIRWVVACFNDPARLAAIAHFEAELDEVEDEDLVNGPATGVARVRAACRARRVERIDEDRTPLAPRPEWFPRDLSFARLLLSPHDLTREGVEMDHCVGGYGGAVRGGDCAIVAIVARDGTRATLEIGLPLYRYERGTARYLRAEPIRQLRGPRNSEPSPACARAARSLVRFLRRRAPVRSYEVQSIETATGGTLDSMAAVCGAYRRRGETDAELRARAEQGFRFGRPAQLVIGRRAVIEGFASDTIEDVVIEGKLIV